MADIIKSFTIPDAYVNELIEVFGEDYIEGSAQTKAQFASQEFDKRIISFIKNRVVSYRRKNQTVDENFDVIAQ